MTYADLHSQIVGNTYNGDPKSVQIADRVLRLAVKNWTPQLREVDREHAINHLKAAVGREYKRLYRDELPVIKFGPIVIFILLAVAGAIIQEVITRLIDWWWPRSAERSPELAAVHWELLRSG